MEIKKGYGVTSVGFMNTRYKKEWKPGYEKGHASRQSGVERWTVYDGMDSYMGTVNVRTGEIAYAGAPCEYNKTFLLSALDTLRKM